jgi:hypothetical protein
MCRGNVRYCVSSSCDRLLASLAGPDADRVTLHCLLSAEGAYVFRVLCDFHLLDLLSERGTISILQNQSVKSVQTD